MFCRFCRVAGALAGAALLILSTDNAPARAVDPAPTMSSNLLANPGAEFGDPSLSAYSSVTVPGWSVTGTPTVIKYGTLRRLPWPLGTPGPTLPAFLGFPRSENGPPDGAAQFFGGGNVASSTLTQTVNLSDAAVAAQIDNGTVPYALSGWLGGFVEDPSEASVTVTFVAGDGQTRLGAGRIGPVTVFDRRLKTALLERQTSGLIPRGARYAQVVVSLKDMNPVIGNYNNAYADNISFKVGIPLPEPPPPAPPDSNVKPLEHVFMIYLENHGVKDIVGSRNAPYINNLIKNYGYGENYFAQAHPSLPNYYPILGGTDFGFNYNCELDCFDAPNLADNIEGAHQGWAAYEQSMPEPCFTQTSGPYSPGELPFLAFHDIVSNTARCRAHVLPLPRMATDLASIPTTPNYAWIAADENHNMEGPINLEFILSLLTDHQYNIKAGDQFLADTLPTIFNSPAFQTQRSAIFITWDEDYNNLSLGIGNEGNHVPMIVIPSRTSGMHQGHLVAKNYNNHYSLLRTIEEALQLAPRLTKNDKYAQPMNEYWQQ